MLKPVGKIRADVAGWAKAGAAEHAFNPRICRKSTPRFWLRSSAVELGEDLATGGFPTSPVQSLIKGLGKWGKRPTGENELQKCGGPLTPSAGLASVGLANDLPSSNAKRTSCTRSLPRDAGPSAPLSARKYCAPRRAADLAGAASPFRFRPSPRRRTGRPPSSRLRRPGLTKKARRRLGRCPRNCPPLPWPSPSSGRPRGWRRPQRLASRGRKAGILQYWHSPSNTSTL
jgi:hypothetical protein